MGARPICTLYNLRVGVSVSHLAYKNFPQLHMKTTRKRMIYMKARSSDGSKLPKMDSLIININSSVRQVIIILII